MSLQQPRKATAITPSDSVDFSFGSGWIYVGGAGVVAAVPEGQDAPVNFTAIAGATLPVVCKRVNTTNTTATLMVAIHE